MQEPKNIYTINVRNEYGKAKDDRILFVLANSMRQAEELVLKQINPTVEKIQSISLIAEFVIY